MNCYPHKSKNSGGAEFVATNQNTQTECTPVEKRVATLIAQLALAGHSVHKLQDGFLVTRWGMSRNCPDLASLVGFARQIGVTQ